MIPVPAYTQIVFIVIKNKSKSLRRVWPVCISVLNATEISIHTHPLGANPAHLIVKAVKFMQNTHNLLQNPLFISYSPT